jgi:NADPH2:quinone reductase
MFTYRVLQPDGPFTRTGTVLPEPLAGQVRVRIHASGVNPLDVKIRSAMAPHAKQPLPATLGLDMAGVVDAIGPGASPFHVGEEVYGMVGGVGGIQGTLAEYMVTPTELLARKPESLNMREAAALPLVAITAWEGLVDRAKVRRGDQVLVHAGAGGVGNIAVQLAAAYGAKVFATVSDAKKHWVERWGATPIDYRTASVEQYVSQHSGGRGFDIVYDTVGGSTLDASFVAAKTYTGHVVSCLGWGTHALAPLSFRGATYSGVFTLLPLLTGKGHAHHGEILREVAALVDAQKIRPLMHERRFSLAEIDAAHTAVKSGYLGKVVVDLV